MTQTKKTRTRKSVANLQQSVSASEIPKYIALELMTYIQATETPILSEFCAQNYIYQEFLLKLAQEDPNIKTCVQILETKKRAALERKIYTQELNATIGGQLLKSWREIVPEAEPKFRVASIEELDALELTDAEIKTYAKINRALSAPTSKKPPH